jgi:molybdopterin converting factor small subunit
MKVNVRLFARARDLAGRDAIILDVPANATVAAVRRCLADACPDLEELLAHSVLAVDLQCADETAQVTGSSEVALLPPVSGG